MNKKYEIVVARYEEKLDWLNFLPSKEDRKYKLTISNSGDPIDAPTADRIVTRENYGREAGHYMEFIINNYDNLLETTVFLQGGPWPHSSPSNLLEVFYGNPEFNFGMSFVGTNTPACIPLVPRWSEAEHIIKSGWQDEKWPEPHSGHGGVPWVIGGGAQFYVKKEIIHKRPKDHYERILECAKDPDSHFAHILEFNWPNVFDLSDS
jgi:hypothetical protein